MIRRFQWAVVEVDLDPRRGSEQGGWRFTVLPLTATQRRLYPAEVLLPKGQAGQPRDSIVLAHQIRTISKEKVRSLVGYLDDNSRRQRVHQAIRDHLDLE